MSVRKGSRSWEEQTKTQLSPTTVRFKCVDAFDSVSHTQISSGVKEPRVRGQSLCCSCPLAIQPPYSEATLMTTSLHPHLEMSWLYEQKSTDHFYYMPFYTILKCSNTPWRSFHLRTYRTLPFSQLHSIPFAAVPSSISSICAISNTFTI